MTPFTRTGAALLAILLLALCPGQSSSAGAATDEGAVTVVTSDPLRHPAAALASYAQLMALPSADSGKVPVSRAPRETGADPCPRDRCVDLRVPVPAGVKVSDNRVRVLLPAGYTAPRNAKRRYPVVFLLNGAKSRYDGWTVKSEIIEISQRWQAILVMPAGGSGDEAGMFSDWYDGSFDWETFHTKVVVPWVDRTFRTVKGARGIAGASMGAIGAINYAAHNPRMFKAVLSISGAVDTTALATGAVAPDVLGPLLSFPGPDLRRVWGDPVRDRASWNRHNPARQVGRLQGVELLITSGTGFSGGSGVYSGTFERNLWNTHCTFLLQLTAAGIPYRARVTQGGIHNWQYFNKPLRWAAPKLLAALR
ncbi:alpha/beta hydrolase family protein [Nocardioides sp.]|uniref:alpha/beta hydrolase n=1 Tax=Nocardioides sp. TaxID=35761 RepID=UPI00272820C7|nr:alpha/beta hydrolase-fold protein [Nocardioides sp.]MDO9455563.1 alpha/beta hydrolase-fold protein [Nocardioides sp.]